MAKPTEARQQPSEMMPRPPGSPFRRMLRFIGSCDELPSDSCQIAWIENERPRSLRILLAGGLGYLNVGDEAQIASNLDRWKRLRPQAELIVLSPKPPLTCEQHKTPSCWAPRQVWFRSEDSPHYFRSGHVFKIWFWIAWFRQTLAARLLRSGRPPLLASRDEVRLLRLLQNADLLHISGGGFLTGMTQSRLWENCLLMRLCQILGTPYLLTGQTLGVFRSVLDRKLATIGLSKALAIHTRDPQDSIRELRSIGIQEPLVAPSFDDALLCQKADPRQVDGHLKRSGIDPKQPYLIANYHRWQQNQAMQKRSLRRFAELCQALAQRLAAQVLFVPMAPSDEPAELEALRLIGAPAGMLLYDYDYRVARGAFTRALVTITMKHHPIIFSFGEGVPVLSIALDDYYIRKNKGAMAHCGQERLCLDEGQFFSAQAIDAINDLAQNRERRAREIRDWLETARSQDGVPIAAALEALQNLD